MICCNSNSNVFGRPIEHKCSILRADVTPASFQSPHIPQVSSLAMAPKTKDSDAPKKPASAYFVFMAEKRAEKPDEKMTMKVCKDLIEMSS